MKRDKARKVLKELTDTCLSSKPGAAVGGFIIKPDSKGSENNNLGYKIGITAALIDESVLSCVKSVAIKHGLSHLWTFNVAERILLIYSPDL
jgi:hypothetical protein